MIDFTESSMVDLAIHRMENETTHGTISISDGTVQITQESKNILHAYFTSHFKESPFYHFYNDIDIESNEVFACIKSIFNDPGSINENTRILTERLDDLKTSVKVSELHVAYFNDICMDDELCDAIGIFKLNFDNQYIKSTPINNSCTISIDKGVDVNKLEKGCLILNTNESDGYKCVVIDKNNVSEPAKYWTESFLSIKPMEDNYFQTKNFLLMCKDFASEKFQGASKLDQLALTSESEKYFDGQKHFEKSSFHEQVLQEPEIIQAFEEFEKGYHEKVDSTLPDEFDIEPSAVKSLKRVFKSVIKLDKNFHIYVHGNRNYIKKGFDEDTGMNFYQVFYKEEK